MSEADNEDRWRRLTRGYDLSTEYRLRTLGHETVGLLQSAYELRKYVEFQFLPHYFGAPPAWRLLLRKLGGPRVLPDFAVVGPIKSGTSDIAVSLMMHPCVTTPLSKEFTTSNTEAWRVFYPTKKEQARHAKEHGAARSGYFPPYLHVMQHVASFAKAVPNAKIVLTLRDPVERAYSHWKWEVFLSGKRGAPHLPFFKDYSTFVDRALDCFPDYPMYSACGFPFLLSGIYYKAVEVWMEHFGRDNVLVLDVGRYFRNRRETLERIWKFIDVPPADVPDAPRHKVNENPLKLPPPDEATRAKVAAFYRPYNEKLFARLGESFDWQP